MKAVTLNSIVGVIRARRGYKTFLSEFINECEIVDAIPIPEGATREQVFKEVFGIEMMMAGLKNMDWWKEPYRLEGREQWKDFVMNVGIESMAHVRNGFASSKKKVIL